MKSVRTILALAAASLIVAVPAFPAVMGFVNNPTGNSTDWGMAVAAAGGTVNSDMDFEGMPLGALDEDFYSSLGVSFSSTNLEVQFGVGPAQLNNLSTPLSMGEGLHPASTFLFLGEDSDPSELVITFDEPVFGVGLFTSDFYAPGDETLRNTLTIEGFTGPGGTGTSLGLFSNVLFNFQRSHLYFMGMISTDQDIRSLVFRSASTAFDEIGVDDVLFARTGLARVPEPATALLLGLGLGLLVTGRRGRPDRRPTEGLSRAFRFESRS